MLNGGTTNLKAIVYYALALILGHGVDYHVNTALLNLLNNVHATFMHLANHLNINAHGLDSLGTAGSSHQLKTKLREGLGQLLHLVLVLVGHSEQDCSIYRNIHARTSHSLIQSTVIVVVDTHNLASGLHLRAKGYIHIGHLIEGEYWGLYCHIMLRAYQTWLEAQLLNCGAHSNLGGNIHHLNICYLAEEWYCTGGTWIYFNYENLIIGHYILDIHKTLYMEANCQTLGIIHNSIFYLLWQSLWRVHRNGVTRMNTSPLDMLHNARDYYIHTIGNGIHFNLGTLHIAVHQNRMLRSYLYCTAHVVNKLFLVIHDFHSTAAQYIRRTNHYRIADFSCALDGILQIGYADTLWSWNTGLGKHLIKALSVLCPVNIIYRSTEDFNPGLAEILSQINGRLPTKLYDNPLWFFLVNNVKNILRGQWLKVKSIGNIKVSGYGFRVIVDNNGLYAHLTQGPY